jgi:AraC family transcriptional regulator
MYYTSLPDPTKPGFDEKLHYSQFRKHNIIFNADADKSHCDRHVGCLSIKMILKGEEWYGVGHQQLAVRPGRFLILNDDQEYSCRIDSPEKTRVLSVFFRKDFAGSVFRDALYREEAFLDNPFAGGDKSLEFFQTLTETDHWLKNHVLGLVHKLNVLGYDRDLVDEQLVFLLRHMIHNHKNETQRAQRVSAIKPGTKTEIYKRLCIAKDVLHSSYMDKPDLAAISHISCLSVPQLVRQFRSVFQTTPHQYLMRVRIEQAANLLKQTSAPVSEITWRCGFEDTSAFCRAFKAVYGISPNVFRGEREISGGILHLQ